MIKTHTPWRWFPLPCLRRSYILHRLRRLLPWIDRKSHSYIVGESGCGKTEFLKLLVILNRRDMRRGGYRSSIVIDPHWDLAFELARVRCFRGCFFRCSCRRSDLVYIDPFLWRKDGRYPVLNPFDVRSARLDKEATETYAQMLVEGFTNTLAKWDITLSLQMETLIEPCVKVLLDRPWSTLHDLRRFMDDDENDDLVELGLQSRFEETPGFFRSLFRKGAYEATKSSIATKIQSLLNNSTFAKVIAGGPSSVDLKNAMDSGKLVILNCGKGRLSSKASEALGRFFLAMVLGVAFRRAKNEDRERVSCELIIDECHNFLGRDIEIILTEARKYGVHAVLAQQVVGQWMSASLRRIILGNSKVKAIGQAGKDSTEVIRREMGIESDWSSPGFLDSPRRGC